MTRAFFRGRRLGNLHACEENVTPAPSTTPHHGLPPRVWREQTITERVYEEPGYTPTPVERIQAT